VDLKPLTTSEVSPELDAKFAVPDLRQFERDFRADKHSEIENFAKLVIEGGARPPI
jgi:hypothetical protein